MLSSERVGHCPVCRRDRVRHANGLGVFDPVDECNCRKTQGTFGRYVDALHDNVDLTRDDAREVLMVLCGLLGKAQSSVLSGDRAGLREALGQLTAIGWRLGEALEEA